MSIRFGLSARELGIGSGQSEPERGQGTGCEVDLSPAGLWPSWEQGFFFSWLLPFLPYQRLCERCSLTVWNKPLRWATVFRLRR